MLSKPLDTRLVLLCLLWLETVSSLSIQRPARALPYTALGCYTDNVNGKRALSGKSAAADDMSVAKCAIFCSQFQLFGVEYGRECYCGNSRDIGSTEANPGDCSFPCAANPNGAETCGAGDRLNLYQNVNPSAPLPATLSSATSLGCFVDSGNRVFPNKIISANDMTAAKCAQNCAGYSYFGTEWSSECYCGNTAPVDPAPASECNMACSGNADELCGGGMRLNAYKVEPTTTAGPAAPAAPVATVLGYAYQGCYTDNVPQRVLSGRVSTDPAMTLEMCATFCKNGGYSWFGVEYNFECYCGTALDSRSTKEPESACNAKCSGDASQMCGGANHMNAYMEPNFVVPSQQSKPLLNGFQYRSCWTDNVIDRSLKDVDYRTDDMTVEKCADRCKEYAFFGLEYARECYCGNALIGQAAPEAECGMLCMGANNEWCGGPDRLNLYTKGATSPAQPPSATAMATTNSFSSTVLSSNAAISSDVSTSLQDSPATVPSTSGLDTSSNTASSIQVGSSSSSTSLSVFEEVTSSSTMTPNPSAATTTSSRVDITTSSSDASSPQSSAFLPSSTTIVSTPTTSEGPALTTVTDCAATSIPIQEFCYASDMLPSACQRLTSNVPYVVASQYISQCRAFLGVAGATASLPATTCFPTPIRVNGPAAASSTVSSIIQCMTAPSASLFCQYGSRCTTSTYTIGQVPAPAATDGVGADLVKDGGFESGTLGEWVETYVLSRPPVTEAINGARPRSGNYGLSLAYNNNNGASIVWSRVIKVIPGKNYQFQAYFQQSNQITGCGISLSIGQGSQTSVAMRNFAPNQWSPVSLTFKSGRSVERLQVQWYCNVYGDVGSADGKNNIWFDDWTLTRLD